MFIAYTDCSVKGGTAFLAFVIVFEDKSKISRRIVVSETDSNIAEALAILELLSFLRYYNIRDGLLLFDSKGVKKQLKNKSRKIHKHIPKDTYKTLRSLNVRTQVINRRLNQAHRICSENKYFSSDSISRINRRYYQKVDNYPDFYLQPSVLEEYRQLYNKPFATFHEVQIKLNHKIWLADLVVDLDEVKVYQLHEKQINVNGDTIIKITKVNYVQVGSHWRVMRKLRKISNMLNKESRFPI